MDTVIVHWFEEFVKSEKSKCSNRFRTFTKDLPLVRLDDCKIFMQFSSVFTKLSTIQNSVKQEEGKEKRERERDNRLMLFKRRERGRRRGRERESYLLSSTIPRWKYAIPSDLASQAALGPASTWIGDGLGIPGVEGFFALSCEVYECHGAYSYLLSTFASCFCV